MSDEGACRADAAEYALGEMTTDRDAWKARAEERERDAYRKAKAENDERFQLDASAWKSRAEAVEHDLAAWKHATACESPAEACADYDQLEAEVAALLELVARLEKVAEAANSLAAAWEEFDSGGPMGTSKHVRRALAVYRAALDAPTGERGGGA